MIAFENGPECVEYARKLGCPKGALCVRSYKRQDSKVFYYVGVTTSADIPTMQKVSALYGSDFAEIFNAEVAIKVGGHVRPVKEGGKLGKKTATVI